MRLQEGQEKYDLDLGGMKAGASCSYMPLRTRVSISPLPGLLANEGDRATPFGGSQGAGPRCQPPASRGAIGQEVPR